MKFVKLITAVIATINTDKIIREKISGVLKRKALINGLRASKARAVRSWTKYRLHVDKLIRSSTRPTAARGIKAQMTAGFQVLGMRRTHIQLPTSVTNTNANPPPRGVGSLCALRELGRSRSLLRISGSNNATNDQLAITERARYSSISEQERVPIDKNILRIKRRVHCQNQEMNGDRRLIYTYHYIKRKHSETAK